MFLRNKEEDNLKATRHDFLQNESNLEKFLPEYLGIPVKKILNNIHFEMFDYNIKDITDSAEMISNLKNEKTVYMFVYADDKKSLDICKAIDVTKNM